jgi:formate/nitrite transporter FocA (FNT family)
MLGAHVSVAQWLIWNEIPVTIGNLLGAIIITAIGLYASYGATAAAEPEAYARAAE